MPKNGTLQVFVASPGDVAKEREILENVVKEINITQSDTHNMRLELLKWETHVHPGFGEDPQEVVTRQIGDKYDIFLAIMWGRLGSPTRRAESGTVEEFDLAYSRWTASRESIEIMVYFKDAAIPPSEVDPDQLSKVQAFRERISSLGGFYGGFQNVEDFKSQVRMHLTKVLQGWPKRASFTPETAKVTTALSPDQSREALNRERLLESWPHSLRYYADSKNFRGSEKNFQLFITPFSGKLSSHQIGALLVAVRENRHNWDAHGTPGLLKDLLEKTSRADFPSAEDRNEFFQFLTSEPSDQGQDDVFFFFSGPSRLSRYEDVIQLLQADGWRPPRADDEE